MKNFNSAKEILIAFIEWCIEIEENPWEGDYESRICQFLSDKGMKSNDIPCPDCDFSNCWAPMLCVKCHEEAMKFNPPDKETLEKIQAAYQKDGGILSPDWVCMLNPMEKE